MTGSLSSHSGSVHTQPSPLWLQTHFNRPLWSLFVSFLLSLLLSRPRCFPLFLLIFGWHNHISFLAVEHWRGYTVVTGRWTSLRHKQICFIANHLFCLCSFCQVKFLVCVNPLTNKPHSDRSASFWSPNPEVKVSSTSLLWSLIRHIQWCSFHTAPLTVPQQHVVSPKLPSSYKRQHYLHGDDGAPREMERVISL